MPFCSFLSSVGMAGHHYSGRDEKYHGTAATLGSAPSCRELSFQEGCKNGPDQVTCDAKQALPEDLSPDSGHKHLTASRFDRAFELPKYSTSAPSLVPMPSVRPTARSSRSLLASVR